MERVPAVPVVLLGGLNVVRALGMSGIPVIIASPDRRTPAMASRFCSGSIELPPFGADAASRAGAVEALVRAGRRLAERHGARPPLFFDNEDRLSLVQDCRDALAPHFALLLNEPGVGEALLDKALFQQLAARLGLPVPREVAWDALAAEAGPVIAKPKVKTAWEHSGVHHQLFGGAGKARIFESGRRAHSDPRVRLLASQLEFQEYLPGEDDEIWSFHGFAAPGGEVLAWFVGRKIRTFPAYTGDSSYIRLAHDDALAALGRDVAARLRLAGVFKMDFKRSAANGRWYLLEINARFNLWHYVGAKNGVNLPRVAYEFLTEGKIPAEKRAGHRFRWLSMRYDWRAFKALRAQGRLSLAGWLWSLARAPKVYDLFAWTDPAPFVRFWRGRFNTRLQRLWHSTAS